MRRLAAAEAFPMKKPDLDWLNRSRNPSNPNPDGFDQSPRWKPDKIQLDDGRILVLDYN